MIKSIKKFFTRFFKNAVDVVDFALETLDLPWFILRYHLILKLILHFFQNADTFICYIKLLIVIWLG